MGTSAQERPKRTKAAAALLFSAVAVAWLALDQLTKSLFSSVESGTLVESLPGGLVDFVAVHNTGAAWGVLSGNPYALGVFSVIVCAVLAGYVLFNAADLNVLQTIGAALVVAGGLGNAIDRFARGYVIDFIAATFVDFPVFNVADIGVTCGVVLLLAGIALAWRKEAKGSEDGSSR